MLTEKSSQKKTVVQKIHEFNVDEIDSRKTVKSFGKALKLKGENAKTGHPKRKASKISVVLKCRLLSNHLRKENLFISIC